MLLSFSEFSAMSFRYFIDSIYLKVVGSKSKHNTYSTYVIESKKYNFFKNKRVKK